MKRTPLKRKTGLKRTAWVRKTGPVTQNFARRTLLRVKGVSSTAQAKNRIQELVREIVIIRDGGCILRFHQHRACGPCSGYAKNGQLVLQADHLVTRGNSATYADTRLIVCLCKGHHGGFKQWNKERYDALVRSILPRETVALWDRAEADRGRAHYVFDWKLHVIALEHELATLQKTKPETIYAR